MNFFKNIWSKRDERGAPTSKAIKVTKRRFADAIESSKELIGGIERGNKDFLHSKAIEEGNDFVIFRYYRDKFSKHVTFYISIIIISLFVYLFLTSSGTYISAWFISIATAIFLLYLLSFPRYIRVTNKNLAISCVLEITVIPLGNIKRIHAINRYRLKRLFPLLGSYGFGGYFGQYFDLIHLRFLHLYLTKKENLIFIQDIYDNRYIVNCEHRQKLIELVRDNIETLKSESQESFLENSSDEEWEDEKWG